MSIVPAAVYCGMWSCNKDGESIGNPLFLPDLAWTLDDGRINLKGFKRAGL